MKKKRRRRRRRWEANNTAWIEKIVLMILERERERRDRERKIRMMMYVCFLGFRVGIWIFGAGQVDVDPWRRDTWERAMGQGKTMASRDGGGDVVLVCV